MCKEQVSETPETHRPDAYDKLCQCYENPPQDGITVDGVKCASCGRTHDVLSGDFVTIRGNIYVGVTGGVVGDNFLNSRRLEKLTFYCRTLECLSDIMLGILVDEQQVLKYKNMCRP